MVSSGGNFADGKLFSCKLKSHSAFLLFRGNIAAEHTLSALFIARYHTCNFVCSFFSSGMITKFYQSRKGFTQFAGSIEFLSHQDTAIF